MIIITIIITTIIITTITIITIITIIITIIIPAILEYIFSAGRMVTNDEQRLLYKIFILLDLEKLKILEIHYSTPNACKCNITTLE